MTGWSNDPGTTNVRYCASGHAVGDSSARYCPACGSPVSDLGQLPSYPPPHQPVGQYAIDPWSAPAAPPASAALPAATHGQNPSTPRTRDKRKAALIIAAVVLLAGGAAAAALLLLGKSGSARATVTGTFVLTDYETMQAGCVGQGGYDDIAPGATVILTNQDGKILGSGALDGGTRHPGLGTCAYHFKISDVPKNEDQYAVEVTHRGKVVDSRAELARNNWNFELTMGG